MCPKRTTAADFEPDIGGLFDDFDSPVTKAYFGSAPAKYAEKMGGEGIGIYLTFDQTYQDKGVEKNVEQFYSIGNVKNWEIKNDGAEVINTKDENKHQFNQNTNAWALVEKMVTHVGEGDFKKGQETFIARDKYMTEAAFYLGLTYHWKQQKVMNPVQKTEHDVLLPDKFIGEVKPEAKATAKAAASADLDAKLVELAHGKTVKEVKSASTKEFKGNSPYIREIINGKKLKELEDAGELFLDGDRETGKYA